MHLQTQQGRNMDQHKVPSWIISCSWQNSRLYCAVMKRYGGLQFTQLSFSEMTSGKHGIVDVSEEIWGPNEGPYDWNVTISTPRFWAYYCLRLWTEQIVWGKNTVISEGALSHGLDPVQHPDPASHQVLSAPVAGWPGLERWGWAMPEPRLSAS